MNIEILDTSFMTIVCLDVFESFIWTERYNSYGDFELYLPMDTSYLSYLQEGNYVSIDDTDSLMIIETLEITTDVEDGDHLKVSGRSLESILDRRVVWEQTILDGKLDGQIQKLLNNNVISPSDSSRTIPNFVFKSSPSSTIEKYTIRAQYTGDNIYEVITSICNMYGLGFRVVLNNNDEFEFYLYSGKDHSYDIDPLMDSSGDYILDCFSDFITGYETTYLVEFSPAFDNLINSNYLESISNERNVALVAGEGEGEERKRITIGEASGLDRRELYVDARDISSGNATMENITSEELEDMWKDNGSVPSEDPEGETHMTEAYYKYLLEERGYEKLAECTDIQTFEGSIDYSREFVYGEDYSIGDIVRIANGYGISAKVRITEIVRSLDENGYEIYPTFEVI